MDRCSIYLEYIKIAHQLRTILPLHNKICLSFPPIKKLTVLLNNNLAITEDLIRQYPNTKEIYDYNSESYLQKVQLHFSLLTGYMTLLISYRDSGFLGRFKSLRKSSCGISQFKLRLKTSLDHLIDIPKISKPNIENNIKEGSINLNEEKIQQHNTFNISSPTIFPQIECSTVMYDDTYVNNTNISPLNIPLQHSISLNKNYEWSSNITPNATLTKEEIRSFIQQCLYSKGITSYSETLISYVTILSFRPRESLDLDFNLDEILKDITLKLD